MICALREASRPFIVGYLGRLMPSLDAEGAGGLQLVHLVARIGLAASHDAALGDIDALDAVHDRAAERIRHPDADLEVAAVGGFVAEQDEVEFPAGCLELPHCVGDRGRSALRIPVQAALRGHQRQLRTAHAGCVAQLLGGRLGTEREHHDGVVVAVEPLGDLGGFLHSAFLMRAGGEAQVCRVDLLAVSGHVDARPHGGHPLDADQDAHAAASGLHAAVVGIEQRQIRTRRFPR